MGNDLGDFLTILTNLPTQWQVIFAVVFFLIPKLVQIFGGNVVLRKASHRMWFGIMSITKRYQARRQMEAEDQGLTEAYTRTLIVESLGMFSTRLRRIDHKINYILLLIEPGVNIEEVEMMSPIRRVTETAVHHRLHERLENVRKKREDD